MQNFESLITQINELINWFDNPLPELKPRALELVRSIEIDARFLGISSDSILFKADLLVLLSKLDDLKSSADQSTLCAFDNKEIYLPVFTLYYSSVIDIARRLDDESLRKSRFTISLSIPKALDYSKYKKPRSTAYFQTRFQKSPFKKSASLYLSLKKYKLSILLLSDLVDPHTSNILRHFGIITLAQLKRNFYKLHQFSGVVLWHDGSFCSNGVPVNTINHSRKVLNYYYSH